VSANVGINARTVGSLSVRVNVCEREQASAYAYAFACCLMCA